MTTYQVTARRWERGWELHIEGVGVTQCRRLTEAEEMVRDYLALDTGADPDSLDVVITPVVDADVAETRRAVEAAMRAQRMAAARSRATARRLRSLGLSGREIAMVLGVSPQRVSQLSKEQAS